MKTIKKLLLLVLLPFTMIIGLTSCNLSNEPSAQQEEFGRDYIYINDIIYNLSVHISNNDIDKPIWNDLFGLTPHNHRHYYIVNHINPKIDVYEKLYNKETYIIYLLKDYFLENDNEKIIRRYKSLWEIEIEIDIDQNLESDYNSDNDYKINYERRIAVLDHFRIE